MKISRSCFPLAALAVLLPSTVCAARADLEADYAQVRKIALRDPGVRAAYAKADAKLDAKILDIDPSLKPIVENRGVAPRTTANRPVGKKPLQGAPPKTSASYIVAKGDTLTSIAARYRVSAADLKSKNGIVDERKLRVGQRLTIPARSATTQRTSRGNDGFWGRISGGQ